MTDIDLDAIEARWRSTYGGMGSPRVAEDYTDAGCRIFAEHGFRDVPALVSRVRELEAERDEDTRVMNALRRQRDAAERKVERLHEVLDLREAIVADAVDNHDVMLPRTVMIDDVITALQDPS